MNLKKIISFITATIMISLFCIGDTSSIQYFKSKNVLYNGRVLILKFENMLVYTLIILMIVGLFQYMI